MINNDSIVTAYDEHLTLVEWLQKVEVLLKNGGLKETTLNDKGNATFTLTLTFNDGTKIESNAMTLTSAGGGSGGSGGNDINVLAVNGDTFTGSIKQDKINLIKLNDNISSVGIAFVSDHGNMLFGLTPEMNSSGSITVRAHILIEKNDENTYQPIWFNLAYYSHFITITSSTSAFFCTYQNSSNDPLNTLDSLKTALAGKCLLCTGHTVTGIAERISGGEETIIVSVVDKSDNSTRAITIDSSFNINDQVSPVE